MIANSKTQNNKQARAAISLALGLASIIFFLTPFVGSAFIGLLCGGTGLFLAFISKGKLGFIFSIAGTSLGLLYMVFWFAFETSISIQMLCA
ncbi:MAG: hypothetical protein FWC69_01425 [Defluviitaleaceae bacterium]|nr:hypothetical protein [Defluviitaleaceae bacterium]